MDHPHLVIAPDIFGLTPEVQELADELAPSRAGLTILDPYQGSRTDFRDEARAYEHFRSHCTIAGYADQVSAAVEALGCSGIELLGFSVGAAAIWALGAAPWSGRVCRATCFYGSRIRDMLHLEPRFPVLLVLPHHEEHFDVHALGEAVAAKPGVRCIRTPYLHGFMNRRSGNYDPAGCRAFLARMASSRVPTPSR